MDASNTRDWDFHLHNLLLNGICLDGEYPYYSDQKKGQGKRFRRFNFRFAGYRYDTNYRFPNDSPYSLDQRGLIYEHQPVPGLPFAQLEQELDYWGSERGWWFKDIPALPRYYDLRLNPINACSNLRFPSGVDGNLRGCVFCHRCYSSARVTEDRRVLTPKQIFDEIFAEHGRDILLYITKVMLITGDLPTEEAMLRLFESVYHQHLHPNGFQGTYSVVTTVVQSDAGMERLAQVDNSLFEFPIECFSRREVILGQRKGIPMTRVLDVLSRARKRFKNIRVNYLVGLDGLEAARRGFGELAEADLVDDVIANIFVPYTLESLQYRCPQSFEMSYVYAMRDILIEFGFRPKKTGTTKDLFSHFEKRVLEDELVPTVCGGP